MHDTAPEKNQTEKFIVELIEEPGKQTPPPDCASDAPRCESGAGEPRILIVDDVGTMRKKMRDILETAGYNIIMEAEDGDEAVAMARAFKPDVVMMDIIMKRMNGIEATQSIRKELPAVKVIMVTSLAKPSLVAESMKAGAANFIRKPFDAVNVRRAVQRVLSH